MLILVEEVEIDELVELVEVDLEVDVLWLVEDVEVVVTAANLKAATIITF